MKTLNDTTPGYEQLTERATALHRHAGEVHRELRLVYLRRAMLPFHATGPKEPSTRLGDLDLLAYELLFDAEEPRVITSDDHCDDTLEWLSQQPRLFWDSFYGGAHEELALHLRSIDLVATNDPWFAPFAVADELRSLRLVELVARYARADERFDGSRAALAKLERAAVFDFATTRCSALLEVTPVDLLASLKVDSHTLTSLHNIFEHRTGWRPNVG